MPAIFDVAPQGQPTNAVHRLSDFALEQGAFDIKEEEELLDPGFEEARGDEVA